MYEQDRRKQPQYMEHYRFCLHKLNSTITYELQRNYTFHDTHSTRLRIATLRRRLVIGRRYRKVSMM